MPELLLVNPSRRRRRTRRTAAQKAATRKMLAARWGSRRVRRSNVAANPSPRRRRRRARRNPWYDAPAAHRRAAKLGWRRRRRSPVRVARRRYRRNPARIAGPMQILQSSLMPAVTAAAGTIGLDVLLGMLPLPDQIKTGPMRHVTRGVGAVAMAMLAPMIPGISARAAGNFATGALTVTFYEAGKEMLNRMAPQLKTLDGLGWSNNGSALGYQWKPETISGMGYYGAGYSPDMPSTTGMLSAFDESEEGAFSSMGQYEEDLEL